MSKNKKSRKLNKKSSYKNLDIQTNSMFKKIFSFYDIVDKGIFSKYDDFFKNFESDFKKYNKYLNVKEKDAEIESKNMLIQRNIYHINVISSNIIHNDDPDGMFFLAEIRMGIRDIEKFIKMTKNEYIKMVKLIADKKNIDLFADYIMIRSKINNYIFNYFVKEFILKKKIFDTHYNEKIINDNTKYDDLEELVYFFNLINNKTSFCNTMPDQWACTDMYDIFFGKKEVIGHKSLSGVVFKTNFSNFIDKPIIVKMSLETNIDKDEGDSLLYEYNVQRKINKMSKYCPNFTLVYNYFNCSPANDLMNFISKGKKMTKSQSLKYFHGNFCSAKKSTKKNEFLLTEYVPGISLNKYVDEKISKNETIQLSMQVMSSVILAQKKLKFVHNDLHGENMMVTDINDIYSKGKNETSYFVYILNNSTLPFVLIEAKKIIKIIDYGRSHVKDKKITYKSLNDSDFIEDKYNEYTDFSFLFNSINTYLMYDVKRSKSKENKNYINNFFIKYGYMKHREELYTDIEILALLKKTKTKIIKIFKDFVTYNIQNNFINLNENDIKSRNVYVYNHSKKHELKLSKNKIKKLIIDYKKFLKNDIKKIDINKYI